MELPSIVQNIQFRGLALVLPEYCICIFVLFPWSMQQTTNIMVKDGGTRKIYFNKYHNNRDG